MTFRLSPSAVNTYFYCPMKFKLQYLDKIRPPTKAKCLVDGIMLHSYYELFYKGMPEEVTKDYLDFYYNRLPKEVRENYKEDIHNFLEFNKRVFDSSEKKFLKPLATEQKIFDEELNFVGIIDCVLTDGKNILVLDFKTGKPKTKIPDDYEFQLVSYIHLWNLRNPDLPATHVGLLYTKGKIGEHNPLTKDVNSLDSSVLFKRINEVNDNIDKGNFPRTEDSYKCRYCDVAMHCLGGMLNDFSK